MVSPERRIPSTPTDSHISPNIEFSEHAYSKMVSEPVSLCILPKFPTLLVLHDKLLVDLCVDTRSGSMFTMALDVLVEFLH